MEYFTDKQVEQILEGAIRILQEIGVKLPNDDYAGRMRAKGFTTCNGRITFDRSRILAQMEHQKGEGWQPGRTRPFGAHTSAYSHSYERIDGSGFDAITDTANKKMAQFVNHVAKTWTGLGPIAPGHPTDIPPELQFLKQAVNSFEWCENFHSMEPVSVIAAPYQFEVCEVMERPITGLPVYVASPLTIAGESFDIVITNAHKLESIWVGSMPSFGANTPMNLIAAYAQTIAETIGGSIICQELTGVPSYFGTNIFTFDFHAMSMPFGTPEKLLLEFMNFELECKLMGRKVTIPSTDIHSNAPRSGAQAAIEKSTLAMAGALRGAQYFSGIGVLGMDELFSPVQLLLDLEMLSHIERIIDGMPMEDFDGDIIEEVRSGIAQGYVQSDRTLDHFKEYVWNSRLFHRHTFSDFIRNHLKDATEKAQDLASSIMQKEPSWRLDDIRVKEINRIYSKACDAVGCSAK